jgi:hypothetical protein
MTFRCPKMDRAEKRKTLGLQMISKLVLHVIASDVNILG